QYSPWPTGSAWSNRGMGDARAHSQRLGGGIYERLVRWEDDRGRTHALVRRVDAGRRHILVRQVPDRTQEAVPGHDDAIVRGDEILLRAIDDGTHAFLQGCILHADTGDAAVGAAGLLRCAVDEVIVVLVGKRSERAGHVFDVDALAVAHRRDLV